MMTYLRPSNKHAQKRAGVTIVTLVAVLILLSGHFMFPHFLPSIFTSLAVPFWRAEFSIDSGSLQSSEKLLLENEELRRLLSETESRYQSVAHIENENIELKNLLGRDDPRSVTLAAV